MSHPEASKNEFLTKLTEIIETNLTNPQFGVSMLARELEMSRSNLHRKVNSIAKISVSQFINQVRIKKAKEILRHTSDTVSDVTYKVGYNNVSYFIKCFHNYYGYPPGEVGKRDKDESNYSVQSNKKRIITILVSATSIIILAVILIIVFKPFSTREKKLEKSIAILPFKNISNDSSIEYFIHGLRENLISNLSKIKDLRVVGSSSMEKYRGNPKPYPEIAEESNVNYIVEVNCQKPKGEIYLDVKLIEAPYDKIIWQENYQKPSDEIFDLQIEVAKTIAEELETVLSSDEIEQIGKIYTKNPEAYNLYLKGRFFWYRRTEIDVRKSIEYFNQALVIDSTYSLAFAGLADAYFILTWWNWYPREEGYSKSKEYAIEALNIDNRLAETHAVLGAVACWYDRNWEVAEKELRYAIKLNPNYATAHQYYSEFLDITGKRDKARKHIDRALELNPHSKVMYSLSSMYYYDEENYFESLKEGKKVLEIDKNYKNQIWRNLKIYLKQKKDLDAIDELQKIISLDTPGISYIDSLHYIYSESGIKGIILWATNWELNKKTPRYYTIASLYSLAGEKDSALDYLEEIFQKKHNSKLPLINCNPDFEILRDDPRFTALLDKMNLADK